MVKISNEKEKESKIKEELYAQVCCILNVIDMKEVKYKGRIMLVLMAIVVAAWLVWYYWLAIYVVYAVGKGPDGKGVREPVYRSMFFDRAKEKYMYMNAHKEEGVKYYILMNNEEGNSLIPF